MQFLECKVSAHRRASISHKDPSPMQRNRHRLTHSLAALGLSLLALQAAHADQLDDIKKKGVLVVGVLGTDEPNSYIDAKTREIIGYEVDLARAIAAKLGVKLQIKQLAV